MPNPNNPKDAWDKLPALSGFIASVLVPIVVVVLHKLKEFTLRCHTCGYLISDSLVYDFSRFVS